MSKLKKVLIYSFVGVILLITYILMPPIPSFELLKLAGYLEGMRESGDYLAKQHRAGRYCYPSHRVPEPRRKTSSCQLKLVQMGYLNPLKLAYVVYRCEDDNKVVHEWKYSVPVFSQVDTQEFCSYSAFDKELNIPIGEATEFNIPITPSFLYKEP